jgi:hypothetical protein
VLRAPAGRLLAPVLPVLMPLLLWDKELAITDDQADLLMRMSAATIDRKLAGERAKFIPRGRSHTKPGTLLKSQIRSGSGPTAQHQDLIGCHTHTRRFRQIHARGPHRR